MENLFTGLIVLLIAGIIGAFIAISIIYFPVFWTVIFILFLILTTAWLIGETIND